MGMGGPQGHGIKKGQLMIAVMYAATLGIIQAFKDALSWSNWEIAYRCD